jgi:SPASM domain peptide maturase of grasp-with-spasm system
MKFPTDIPFHVFNSCIPVKGVERSVIYDLQRNNFEYISNSLFDILINNQNKTIEDLLFLIQDDNEIEILKSYFSFLHENEFIFFSKLNSNFFPKYEISFDKPYNFSCLVIDFIMPNSNYLEKLKIEIYNSKIHCIIFRFLDPKESEIKKIIEFFNDIPVRTIQIVVDYKFEISDFFFENLIEVNNRVSIILKYNSEKKTATNIKRGVIIHTKRDVINTNLIINDISDFDVNLDLFMESNLYNNFFHKRIYVNFLGEIRRHENDTINFGNINNVSLNDTLKNEQFKEFWYISKEKVEICCNCEYRYMCVDARLPLYKNESNFWVLENDCKYSPSSAKWKQ